MAETPQAPSGGAAPDQGNAPRLMIQSQYVKDLSFENPRAPASLQSSSRPEIQIRVDVGAQPIAAERYEVILQLRVEAQSGGESAFIVELTYGGVFGLMNIPQENLQPLLLVECPRLLFPFARRVIADATRDGGFPPLMIDPIDFTVLYRRRQEQAQAEARARAAEGPAEGQGQPVANPVVGDGASNGS